MSVYKKNIDTEELEKLPGYLYEGEVIVVEDEQEVSGVVEELSSCLLLGFDTETRPSFKKGVSHRVGLLQLSSDHRVFLFRLNKCGFPLELRKLLENENIIKIGVGIRDDIRALRRLGEFAPAAFLDRKFDTFF